MRGCVIAGCPRFIPRINMLWCPTSWLLLGSHFLLGERQQAAPPTNAPTALPPMPDSLWVGCADGTMPSRLPFPRAHTRYKHHTDVMDLWQSG